MKRRDFSVAIAGAAALSMGGPSAVALAQGSKPVAGTHYLVIDPRASVEAPVGKIEVVEFFWYRCGACNAFEPMLDAWVNRLPKDVAFRRVPRRFNDSEVPEQQLYYALEAMGLVEKLQRKVFAAVHVERKQLTRGDAIADWVATQGVDKAKFLDQYNSFSVMTKVSKALQLQNAYKVEGVPALGVAGRFLTDSQLANGSDRALQVVESLISDIRAGRA
jgi:protein dithiol oxidoreductase (disulfide-forming)